MNSNIVMQGSIHTMSRQRSLKHMNHDFKGFIVRPSQKKYNDLFSTILSSVRNKLIIRALVNRNPTSMESTFERMIQS